MIQLVNFDVFISPASGNRQYFVNIPLGRTGMSQHVCMNDQAYVIDTVGRRRNDIAHHLTRKGSLITNCHHYQMLNLISGQHISAMILLIEL